MKEVLNWVHSTLFGQKATETVSIRPAVAEDGLFIFQLTIEQVKKGHLNSDYLIPAAQNGLAQQIGAAIGDAPVPMPGARDGAGARVEVLTVKGRPAGFAFFLEDRPGSWERDVEMFVVALTDEFQGRGLGKFFVKDVLSRLKSKRIYARCKPASERMVTILKSLGFHETGKSPSGTITLERRAQ